MKERQQRKIGTDGKKHKEIDHIFVKTLIIKKNIISAANTSLNSSFVLLDCSLSLLLGIIFLALGYKSPET